MQMNGFNVSGVLAKAKAIRVYLPAGSLFTSRVASEQQKKKKKAGKTHNYTEKPRRCKGKPNGHLFGTLTNQATDWGQIKSDTFIGHFGMRRGSSQVL